MGKRPRQSAALARPAAAALPAAKAAKAAAKAATAAAKPEPAAKRKRRAPPDPAAEAAAPEAAGAAAPVGAQPGSAVEDAAAAQAAAARPAAPAAGSAGAAAAPPRAEYRWSQLRDGDFTAITLVLDGGPAFQELEAAVNKEVMMQKRRRENRGDRTLDCQRVSWQPPPAEGPPADPDAGAAAQAAGPRAAPRGLWVPGGRKKTGGSKAAFVYGELRRFLAQNCQELKPLVIGHRLGEAFSAEPPEAGAWGYIYHVQRWQGKAWMYPWRQDGPAAAPGDLAQPAPDAGGLPGVAAGGAPAAAAQAAAAQPARPTPPRAAPGVGSSGWKELMAKELRVPPPAVQFSWGQEPLWKRGARWGKVQRRIGGGAGGVRRKGRQMRIGGHGHEEGGMGEEGEWEEEEAA